VSTVDMKLELVVIPVTDVDRAKAFYSRLGWRVDADFANGALRVVQFTPPGSACSIVFGHDVTAQPAGSAWGLQLSVSDIEVARADLAAKGVEVSEVFHDVGGMFHHAGTEGRIPGPDPTRRSYASFASFRDPDGNVWWLQEITSRLPGRVNGEDTTYTSAGELAAALRRAEAAHGEHEKRIGHADADWPDWYADFMVREQAGKPLPR
jgi:catechol 2,3-dioxygenase-like lactoylglutathione lyase family enzyme